MQDFQNSLVIRLNLRHSVVNLRHTVGQKTFVSHFSLQRAHMHASVLKKCLVQSLFFLSFQICKTIEGNNNIRVLLNCVPNKKEVIQLGPSDKSETVWLNLLLLWLGLLQCEWLLMSLVCLYPGYSKQQQYQDQRNITEQRVSFWGASSLLEYELQLGSEHSSHRALNN